MTPLSEPPASLPIQQPRRLFSGAVFCHPMPGAISGTEQCRMIRLICGSRIRSVELIVQPAAKDPVGEMAIRRNLPPPIPPSLTELAEVTLVVSRWPRSM